MKEAMREAKVTRSNPMLTPMHISHEKSPDLTLHVCEPLIEYF